MDDFKRKMETTVRWYSYDKAGLTSKISQEARRLARTRFKRQSDKVAKQQRDDTLE